MTCCLQRPQPQTSLGRFQQSDCLQLLKQRCTLCMLQCNMQLSVCSALGHLESLVQGTGDPKTVLFGCSVFLRRKRNCVGKRLHTWRNCHSSNSMSCHVYLLLSCLFGWLCRGWDEQASIAQAAMLVKLLLATILMLFITDSHPALLSELDTSCF